MGSKVARDTNGKYYCRVCGRAGFRNWHAAQGHRRWCRGIQGVEDDLEGILASATDDIVAPTSERASERASEPVIEPIGSLTASELYKAPANASMATNDIVQMQTMVHLLQRQIAQQNEVIKRQNQMIQRITRATLNETYHLERDREFPVWKVLGAVAVGCVAIYMLKDSGKAKQAAGKALIGAVGKRALEAIF